MDGLTRIQSYLRAILTLLFPITCAGCSKEGYAVCQTCASALQPYAPQCFVCDKRSLTASVCSSCRTHVFYTHTYAPFRYKHPLIRELIHRLKYRAARAYGSAAGALLARAVVHYALPIPHTAVVVPVPLHHTRLRVRGFNQAEVIASSFADALHVPVADNSLIRKKRTPPQVSMASYAARKKNMRNAFFVADATPIYRRDVILIDDVATTGSTVDDAARALREGGARSVWVCTLAS